jgi:beta-glucanase (GH16 family)
VVEELETRALLSTLVWSDEFDGPVNSPPDPARWTRDLGGGGWGNHELEVYTNSVNNASIVADPDAMDGKALAIRAIKESNGTYTSARLKTQDTMSWSYGRFEARARLPYGQGMWPAFWMLGTDIRSAGWPGCGEIDIMENIGREPGTVHGTMHGPGYSGGNGIGAAYTLPDGQQFSDAYHVFAVEWTPNTINWYVDDQLYETRTPADLPPGRSWVFDRSFFVLLNLAVGGDWPGNPDGTTVFPQTYLVDYVRVYADDANFTAPDFSGGFGTTDGLIANGFGNASLTSGTALRLTDGNGFEARSVWYNIRQPVDVFTSHFTFLIDPNNNDADGFTFAVQNDADGTAARGGLGGNLGYVGVKRSVAVFFRLYPSANLVGQYVNGTVTDSISLDGSGIDLHSGALYDTVLTYDGTALSVTITDLANPDTTFTTTFSSVDIPATVGAPSAYVGFTGGTGGGTAIQDILTWTYYQGNGPFAPQGIGGLPIGSSGPAPTAAAPGPSAADISNTRSEASTGGPRADAPRPFNRNAHRSSWGVVAQTPDFLGFFSFSSVTLPSGVMVISTVFLSAVNNSSYTSTTIFPPTALLISSTLVNDALGCFRSTAARTFSGKSLASISFSTTSMSPLGEKVTSSPLPLRFM